MIKNTRIGICKQCILKDVPCLEREKSDESNLLVTYACAGFKGTKKPLKCDIEKCSNPATKYVDDNGVDTVLCEVHHKQFLQFEKREYCDPCERTLPECGDCKGPQISGNSRRFNTSEIPNSSIKDECKCPKDCTSDCAGCRYNWEENDKELGFV
jgi:hypothetical protein